MKKWYVYEIVNLMGTIEYVGESTRPYERFINHTKHKGSPNNSFGRFYGRTDVFMNLAAEFDNKIDAFEYQCELQKQYGLISDRDKHANNKSYRKANIILQYDINGNFIKEYPSLCKAGETLSIAKQMIKRVCDKEYKQTHGYIFRYKIVK